MSRRPARALDAAHPDRHRPPLQSIVISHVHRSDCPPGDNVVEGNRKKPDSFAKLIGGRVRKLREEKDWSFDAFVEETGLGRGYISELERGLVVPTVTSLAKLAKALEVTVADLVLGESPRERLLDVSRLLDDRSVAALLRQAQALTPSS
jgi:transcriptional regulator with XRE-family HTH domain